MISQQQSLHQVLDAWEVPFANLPTLEDNTTWLAIVYQQAHADIHQLGTAIEAALNANSTLAYPEAFICYEWMEHGKLFLLLLRDILFEQQKINILILDGACTTTLKKVIWDKSIVVLKEAFASLRKQALPNKKRQKRQIKQWKHQENPWPVYKKQIQAIDKQVHQLMDNKNELIQCHQLFTKIEALVFETLETVGTTLQDHQSSVESILDMLLFSTDADYSKKVLLDIQKNINTSTHIPIDIFQNKLKERFTDHDKIISPIIAIRGGNVETRDFKPQHDITTWLTADIYPLLFELWEILEREESSFKMLLVNLTNRMEIVCKKTPNLSPEDRNNLQNTISNFSNNLIINKESVDKLAQLVNTEIKTHFKISLLFDTQKHFLPISALQSTFSSRFWQTEEGWIGKLRTFLLKGKLQLTKLKAKFLAKQNLSVSERMVIALKNRQLDPANKHYTSIFMTKGYVGDSFIVGREDELTRIESIVNDWKDGYRGALLFYGERFSGKTTLLEIVVRKFFNNSCYRIVPNNELNINGRKLKTSSDLKEALDFVCKYQDHNMPIVLIDDLELWYSDKVPFFQNIHHLSQCIDAYSKKIFFIVTTNSFLQKQLQIYCDFNKVFQAQIDLSYLSKKALQRAISIRHGATHKTLVNTNGEEVPPGLLDKYITQLHKNCQGNIGEGLQRWVNSTSFHNENSIIYHKSKYTSLPVFMNEDTLLVLEILLKYKQSNEYLLSHLLGKSFGERYRTVIKRLSSMKLIHRNLDGSLEVEPTIVNDLKHMIE